MKRRRYTAKIGTYQKGVKTMENPKNVKRSIRIPKEINQKLKVIAMENNKSINKLILEIIKDWI